MNVTINGTVLEMEPGAVVTHAIETAGHQGGFGIAVALNGEVVPRSRWTDTALAEGDRVEILVAAQGG